MPTPKLALTETEESSTARTKASDWMLAGRMASVRPNVNFLVPALSWVCTVFPWTLCATKKKWDTVDISVGQNSFSYSWAPAKDIDHQMMLHCWKWKLENAYASSTGIPLGRGGYIENWKGAQTCIKRQNNGNWGIDFFLWRLFYRKYASCNATWQKLSALTW